jgi:hypothetical protein
MAGWFDTAASLNPFLSLIVPGWSSATERVGTNWGRRLRLDVTEAESGGRAFG